MSAHSVAGCLLLLEISSSFRDVLAEGWTAQPGGHSCAQCAERLLVHPEVSPHETPRAQCCAISFCSTCSDCFLFTLPAFHSPAPLQLLTHQSYSFRCSGLSSRLLFVVIPLELPHFCVPKTFLVDTTCWRREASPATRICISRS